MIHYDIWGPYRIASLCGAHYFLSIVDEASRATWVYLMKEKGEASKILKEFIIMIRNQFHKGIKVVRSDNGSEFTSRPMQTFMVNMEFCKKVVAWIPPNKMEGWNASIDMYLMLPEHLVSSKPPNSVLGGMCTHSSIFNK